MPSAYRNCMPLSSCFHVFTFVILKELSLLILFLMLKPQSHFTGSLTLALICRYPDLPLLFNLPSLPTPLNGNVSSINAELSPYPSSLSSLVSHRWSHRRMSCTRLYDNIYSIALSLWRHSPEWWIISNSSPISLLLCVREYSVPLQVSFNLAFHIPSRHSTSVDGASCFHR